jgi:hypothetical protein
MPRLAERLWAIFPTSEVSKHMMSSSQKGIERAGHSTTGASERRDQGADQEDRLDFDMGCQKEYIESERERRAKEVECRSWRAASNYVGYYCEMRIGKVGEDADCGKRAVSVNM